MDKIVKICKNHGELNINEVYKRKDKKNSYKCKKCQRKHVSNFLKNNYGRYYLLRKHLTLKSALKKTYGITFEKYNEMLIKQNYKCAICKKEETMKDKNKNTLRLAIDHCHSSADNGILKIRGLLCSQCNNGIGRFKDSIELLQSAIQYLIKNS